MMTVRLMPAGMMSKRLRWGFWALIGCCFLPARSEAALEVSAVRAAAGEAISAPRVLNPLPGLPPSLAAPPALTVGIFQFGAPALPVPEPPPVIGAVQQFPVPEGTPLRASASGAAPEALLARMADALERRLARAREPALRALLEAAAARLRAPGTVLPDERGRWTLHLENGHVGKDGFEAVGADLAWSESRADFSGLSVFSESERTRIPGVDWDYEATAFRATADGELEEASDVRRISRYEQRRDDLPVQAPRVKAEFDSHSASLQAAFGVSGHEALWEKTAKAKYHKLVKSEQSQEGDGIRLLELSSELKEGQGGALLELQLGTRSITQRSGPGEFERVDEGMYRYYHVGRAGELMQAQDFWARRTSSESERSLPLDQETRRRFLLTIQTITEALRALRDRQD